MIKVLAPAQKHPTNRTLAAFHNYWGESHGPLFANTRGLRRYVQHLTLPDAYGVDPAPTYDGVSMFWFDDYESRRVVSPPPELLPLYQAVLGISFAAADPSQPRRDDPAATALVTAVLRDDCQLFDRSAGWPMHRKRALVAAQERVIVDGPAAPEMVKAIFVVSKLPGLTLDEFSRRWQHHLGPIVAGVPGLRRYVQNHALPEAYADRGQTHDGWSELWFDDLGALRAALGSGEWRAVRDAGAELFAAPVGVGVARERVQKEVDWVYRDWQANAMSVADVRLLLSEQGFTALANDPEAPVQIKAAAATEALAVWTAEHIVTIDRSGIDARPDR